MNQTVVMAIDRRSTRLGVLAVVATILVALLGTRLWFLQGVQASTFQASVDAAKTRVVRLPPERGRIFDRDGRILADNQRVLTVTVDWSVVRNRDKTRAALFDRLSGPLGTPVADLEARYQEGILVDDPLLPMPLVEDVDEETVQYLLERSEDFPGVDVATTWRRMYPYAPLASHIIGYMGAITKETKDQYVGAGYILNERVGQFGIELGEETTLHGTWGYQKWEIDAAGNRVRLLEEVDPIAGNDVQLSIDLDLQQYAEQALETKLKQRRELPEDTAEADHAAHNPIDPKSKEELRVYASSKDFGTEEWIQYKAPAGSVVVLDNSNGQVLAMASYPTFDNRWFNAGVSKQKLDQLFPESDDPDRSILVNRAVQGRYNIGSTIKPFIAWSAMHSGLITADDIWQDDGVYKLTSIEQETCAEGVRCEFKNALDPFGVPSKYGPVRVEDALAVSSDTFFYRLGEAFFTLPGRRDELKADLSEFGFGADTGVELPFEWDGRIPDDAVKAELVDKGVLAKGEVPRLVTGDLVQVSIGQGLFATTPLQLATAYGAFANGGFVMRPHIVRAIYAPLTPDKTPGFADLEAGTVVESFVSPDITNQLQMPPEIGLPIVQGLSRVICPQSAEGESCGVTYPTKPVARYRATTGERLFRGYPHDVLPIAGKTGTAQGAGAYPWNDSSVFAAFSLDTNQPYTVVAYLEKSGYGSKAAAPVVKCIFTALAGTAVLDPVVPADQLDVNSPYPAPPNKLIDDTCLGGYDASVRE